MRKLASIQKVLEINPIKGADKIEVAKILGWEVVIKKGEFTIGDHVIYLEIDSLLPRMPWNQFLFKDDTRDTFRLKTVKLRGQISQGLLLPISVLSQYENPPIIEEGLEVTELLKITKYEPSIPAELHGLIKGQFPSRIPKTDEPRCLHESVIVATEFGNMTIEDICKNNFYGKVLSYNDELGTLEYKNITGHEVTKNNNDWYEIDIGDNITIIATGNHMIYLPECDIYRRVDELNGDESVSFLIKN